MDIQLLKKLLELSYKGNAVTGSRLFEHYPENQDTLNRLVDLEKNGFINILYSEDTVEDISFNTKALNYFK